MSCKQWKWCIADTGVTYTCTDRILKTCRFSMTASTNLGQVIFQRQNAPSQAVLKRRSLSAKAPTPFMGTRGHAFQVKMGSTWVQLRCIFLSHSQIKRFFFQGEVHYFGTKVFCFTELAFRQSLETWDVKTAECWWVCTVRDKGTRSSYELVMLQR